jgi:tRNA pseudouridine55 synthase
VSAVKIDGVRSYDRVRAGEDVDLPTRTVTVSHLAVLAVRRTALETAGAGSSDPGSVPCVVDADVTVVCSSGTYVRALARDLGEALGVGGHLTALRRTRVGPFGLEGSHPLAELEELVDRQAEAARAEAEPGAEAERATAASAVLPLTDVLAASYPRIDVDDATVTLVLHGVQLPVLETQPAGPVGVFGPDGSVLALAEPRDGRLTYLVVFS